MKLLLKSTSPFTAMSSLWEQFRQQSPLADCKSGHRFLSLLPLPCPRRCCCWLVSALLFASCFLEILARPVRAMWKFSNFFPFNTSVLFILRSLCVATRPSKSPIFFSQGWDVVCPEKRGENWKIRDLKTSTRQACCLTHQQIVKLKRNISKYWDGNAVLHPPISVILEHRSLCNDANHPTKLGSILQVGVNLCFSLGFGT